MNMFPWKLFIEFFVRNLLKEVSIMEENRVVTNGTSMLKKYTSRKFIMSLVGVIVGVLGMFAVPDNTIATVAFIILEIASVLAYVISEGRIDAKSVEASIKVVQEASEVISAIKEGRDAEIDKSQGVQNELFDAAEKNNQNNQ